MRYHQHWRHLFRCLQSPLAKFLTQPRLKERVSLLPILMELSYDYECFKNMHQYAYTLILRSLNQNELAVILQLKGWLRQKRGVWIWTWHAKTKLYPAWELNFKQVLCCILASNFWWNHRVQYCVPSEWQCEIASVSDTTVWMVKGKWGNSWIYFGFNSLYLVCRRDGWKYQELEEMKMNTKRQATFILTWKIDFRLRNMDIYLYIFIVTYIIILYKCSIELNIRFRQNTRTQCERWLIPTRGQLLMALGALVLIRWIKKRLYQMQHRWVLSDGALTSTLG